MSLYPHDEISSAQRAMNKQDIPCPAAHPLGGAHFLPGPAPCSGHFLPSPASRTGYFPSCFLTHRFPWLPGPTVTNYLKFGGLKQPKSIFSCSVSQVQGKGVCLRLRPCKKIVPHPFQPLVAAALQGPSQQQVESRLGELLKCRQAAPPTPPPPRAQPPGPWPLSSPGPRLVFNRVNGRRPPATSPSLEGTQETYTLAHEENVRFVSEAWQQVEQQLGGGPAGESGPRPVQYMEKTPNPRLQNFVPIDLDEWWAQQFLARITNCS
uniref:MAPK regulated corepressor interacting protein 2 n=1 Tax=Suricata suricatta TaxID=37032 RepID=A0A673TMY2_SURSU